MKINVRSFEDYMCLLAIGMMVIMFTMSAFCTGPLINQEVVAVDQVSFDSEKYHEALDFMFETGEIEVGFLYAVTAIEEFQNKQIVEAEK